MAVVRVAGDEVKDGEFVTGPPADHGVHSGELRVPEVAPRDTQFGNKRKHLKCIKTIPKVLLRNMITIY